MPTFSEQCSQPGWLKVTSAANAFTTATSSVQSCVYIYLGMLVLLISRVVSSFDDCVADDENAKFLVRGEAERGIVGGRLGDELRIIKWIGFYALAGNRNGSRNVNFV